MTVCFKINKSTGAYSCYSNDCFSNKANKIKLYQHLGSLNRFSSNRFSYTSTIKEFIPPKLITEHIKLATVIEKPLIEIIIDGNLQYTYYYHSDTQRIQRIDYLDKSDKKKVFPQHYDNEWVYGISETFAPFCSKQFKGEVHIVPEGAKSSYKVIERGYNAFSFQQYNEIEITKGLEQIKPKAIVVLLDNDLVSNNKQKKITDIAWKLGINTLTIDIKDLWSLADIKDECVKGADIYDLLVLRPNIDLQGIINEYRSRKDSSS